MTSTRSSRKERNPSQLSRVYRWELGSTRILTFIYTIASLAIMPGSMLMSVLSLSDYYSDASQWEDSPLEVVRGYFANEVISSYEIVLGTGMFVLLCGFVICFAGRSFSYMHTRRSVDLFHALPVKRTPLLMGKYLADLTVLLIPQGIGAALCTLICSVYQVPVQPFYFWMKLGTMALLTTACFTFATLFMVVSGALPGAFLSMIFANLGWPITMGLAETCMYRFLPGYVSVMTDEIKMLFCPVGALEQVLQSRGIGYLLGTSAFDDEIEMSTTQVSSWFLIWWAVLTVAMLLAAIFYYNRRKSESAENYFSFPVIRGLLRGLISIAAGLQIGITLGDMFQSNEAFLTGILLGAAAAHIVGQFILTHSFKEFWKTLPAFAASLGVVAVFLGCLYTGGLGYVHRIPNAADVERVDFYLPSSYTDGSKEAYLSQRLGIEVSDSRDNFLCELLPVITEEADVEVLEAFHKAVLDARYTGPYLPYRDREYAASTFEVTYIMKDGSTLRRNYQFYILDTDTEMVDALATVQKLDAIQHCSIFYYVEPDSIGQVMEQEYGATYEYNAYAENMTEEEKKLVWDTFVEELNSNQQVVEPDMMTQEELERELNSGDDSGWIWSNERSDENPYHSFTINVSRVSIKTVPEQLQKLIDMSYDGTLGAPAELLGCDFDVPESCTKTRQLIHELSEPYGERYDYNSYDEDDVWED